MNANSVTNHAAIFLKININRPSLHFFLEKLTEAQKKAADMDGDGKITASDARDILRKSVGLED